LFVCIVERYLLSSALTGIISQKLARRLCPKCKALRKTNEYEKRLFRKVLTKEVNEIYSAVGCEECGNGYTGRVAIHEVLVINQDMRDALSSGMSKEKLRSLVYSSDVITLLQDGLEKVIGGLSTFEEVLKLIELEDDDKLAGELDLKKALEFAEIANEDKTDVKVPTASISEVTGNNLASTFDNNIDANNLTYGVPQNTNLITPITNTIPVQSTTNVTPSYNTGVVEEVPPQATSIPKGIADLLNDRR
jgi:hypothetical protein